MGVRRSWWPINPPPQLQAYERPGLELCLDLDSQPKGLRRNWELSDDDEHKWIDLSFHDEHDDSGLSKNSLYLDQHDFELQHNQQGFGIRVLV